MERRHESLEDEDGVQPRDLPHDLITHNILTRLPIKPLIRFKSVSKQWYSTISSPHFAHAHFKFPHPSSPTTSLIIKSNNKFQFISCDDNDDENASKFDINLLKAVDFDAGDEKLVLVGSCNGLVCLGSISGCIFIIWNPITHEFHKYFDSEICDHFTKTCTVSWGFGYVSAIDDYSIVRIRAKELSQFFKVHVFSIKLNKWRTIDEKTCHDFTDLQDAEGLHKPGVLVNDTLYWLVQGSQIIISFDLTENLFKMLRYRADCDRISVHCFLFVTNGCLCKYRSLHYGKYSGGGVIIVLIKDFTCYTESPGNLLHLTRLQMGFDRICGFTNSSKVFKLDGPDLAIYDLKEWPRRLTPWITLEEYSETDEMSSYSPTLISPT